jgi:hypothetical protein
MGGGGAAAIEILKFNFFHHKTSFFILRHFFKNDFGFRQ